MASIDKLATHLLPYQSNFINGQSAMQAFSDYQRDHQLVADASQLHIMQIFESIYQQIKQQQATHRLTHRVTHRWTKLWRKNETDMQGLYLYGTPGSGKTMMMDIFFDCLPTAKKITLHFHEFMRQIHRCLHDLRAEQSDKKLEIIAREIAKIADIICFDEFHVTDITDAMLLKNLFQALFARNIMLIATSNVAPKNLYLHGIQRNLFLPFIDLLKENCQILSIDAQQDYRGQNTEQPFWYLNHPIDRRNFDRIYQKTIADEASHSNEFILPDQRKITLLASHAKTLRASFAQLCDTALAANDYLVLAENFDCFFISDIPQMAQQDRNALKRFILLIDVLYNEKKQLYCLAQSDILQIYQGASHKDEFDRTISRLLEMESDTWQTIISTR